MKKVKETVVNFMAKAAGVTIGLLAFVVMIVIPVTLILGCIKLIMMMFGG